MLFLTLCVISLVAGNDDGKFKYCRHSFLFLLKNYYQIRVNEKVNVFFFDIIFL